MITFNTWVDVEKHYLSFPVKRFRMVADGIEDMALQFLTHYQNWVEKNYIDTPTFTVKEQDSIDSSDAYDRATCHN